MAGIYIHIPFCRKKCNYCNFFSLATTKFRNEFFHALLKEIDLTRHYLGNEPIETMYFGGGTPSLLPVSQLEGIIEKIRDTGYEIRDTRYGIRDTGLTTIDSELPVTHRLSRIPYHDSPEVTLEMNPDDVTPEYLNALSMSPVNRISLGVQSFFDKDLKYLSRSHDARQAKRAVEMLRDTRYGMWDEGGRRRDEGRGEKFVIRKSETVNLSVDLIYGIPTLSNVHWKSNLQRVIDLRIPHLSAYALTVEPKTALAWQIRKGADKRTSGQADKRTNGMNPSAKPHFTDRVSRIAYRVSRITDHGSQIRYPVSDDQSAEQFEILMDMMEQAGYIQYEISNFCLPGFESRHNSNYWKGIPYLGLGPSAHSYNGASRRWNISNLTAYINGIESGIPLFEEELLTPAQRYNEYVMTSLRTIHGADPAEIGKRFGPEFETLFRHQAIRHLASGHLTEKSGIFTLTRNWKFLADGIAADLFMVE